MTEFLKFCLPGDKICLSENCRAVENCYILEGFVRASTPGKAFKESKDDQYLEISVVSPLSQCKVPVPNSLIIAKILRVNQNKARCIILMVDGLPLNSRFHGIIRREDVRAKEKDKVDMYKCFKPCDIIIAKVISFGDTLDYLLSTAENELGVINAVSDTGEKLIPISWTEFRNPKTNQKEFRKVAKVQPEFYSN